MLRNATLGDVAIVVLASLGIVGFWRGSWNLLDFYLFPEHFLLSQFVSIFFGLLILIVLAQMRN